MPVGIVYEDKSKWRSRVVVRYGPPISMDEYEPEFLSENEGAARSAVKKLTRRIEIEMFKLTINAPDWWVPRLIRLTLGTRFMLLQWQDSFCGRPSNSP